MHTPSIIKVTGLPRSGTAFVAMLLALHPNCISYHELAAHDKNWKQTLLNSPYKYAADCSTYGFLPEAQTGHDKAIYIIHNEHKSRNSAQKAVQRELDPALFCHIKTRSEQWALSVGAYIIERKDVFTLDGCYDLWQYCFPGEHFPARKVAELVKLNIQHHNAHIFAGKDVIFAV